MLDTKKSRAWVIAGVVIAVTVVGAVVTIVGDRAMADQRADFVAAAEDRLADIDAAEVADLVLDDTMDTAVGEPSELTELLVIDGREPRLVSYLRDGVEARYELEAWAQSASVIVRVDADGLNIVTE